jgi:hypothetical protein
MSVSTLLVIPSIIFTVGGWLESGLRVDFFALADFFGEATLVAVDFLGVAFFAVAFFATGFLVAALAVVFFTGFFVAMIILLNFELRYLG